MIISLYAGGMTVRDIQHHLERTLGVEPYHDTISKITDAIAKEAKAWQNRPLDEIYPIIYLDALVAKVRRDHHVNGHAHIGIGVDLDGVKHVLGSGCKPPKGQSLAVATPSSNWLWLAVRDVPTTITSTSHQFRSYTQTT